MTKEDITDAADAADKEFFNDPPSVGAAIAAADEAVDHARMDVAAIEAENTQARLDAAELEERILNAAVVCHETLRAYLKTLKDETLPPWGSYPANRQEATRTALRAILEHGPSEGSAGKFYPAWLFKAWPEDGMLAGELSVRSLPKVGELFIAVAQVMLAGK